MSKILVFAGTTEGRQICEYLCENKIEAFASVATEYGETVLPQSDFLTVLVGRMDTVMMTEFITNAKIESIIDATHPYAVEVTDNIKASCKKTNTLYIRLLRESLKVHDKTIFVDSITEAVAFLNTNKGNALITTGSKGLKEFTHVIHYKSRLTVRVLPNAEVIKSCNELGFFGQNLIGMQGPFSEDMNYITLKDIKADYLVTKETGTVGGFKEKIDAAKRAEVKVIVIKRPKEEVGYSVLEVKEMLRNIHMEG